MNISEVTRINRQGVIALLYSHDDGFTRHVVEIYLGRQYICWINEVPCFRRGTHEHMARLHGFELARLEQVWPSNLAEGENLRQAFAKLREVNDEK